MVNIFFSNINANSFSSSFFTMMAILFNYHGNFIFM